jgi:hypothetical protein
MHYPYINEYISKFEGLARLAGYTQGNAKVTHYFLKGLTRSILKEVMRGATPTRYAAIKQKAIDTTRSQQLLNSLLSRQTGGGFQGGAFRQFQRQQQCQLFFRPNNFNNQGGGQTNTMPRPSTTPPMPHDHTTMSLS